MEWVELPNVHGMALFADPGFTTKPYAASGAYIDRMSDYCKGCHFDKKARLGERPLQRALAAASQGNWVPLAQAAAKRR